MTTDELSPATPETPVAAGTESMRVGAIYRLAFARKQHPELGRALAEAQLDVAAAIMAMDEAEDQVPVHHNLHEQVAVEAALKGYGQALADLIRGESAS